jgi:capsular polysaccharide transport system ATP-binding protein
MIALVDSTRRVLDRGTEREILAPTTATFADGERIGILAARGSGKSVIARLLSGIEEPDHGQILRSGRISWPIGFAGALHPDLTPAENIRLLANLLGEDPQELTAFCDTIARLGSALDRPMRSASPALRAAIAWCLSIGVACDTYIADDVIGFGLGAERDLSEALLESRLQTAGLVFLSSNPQQLDRFCDRFYVLISAQLVPCNDLRAGQEALSEALVPGPSDPSRAEHV